MHENKPDTPTKWIDRDDAPELTDTFFEQADEFMGARLIRSGHPPSDKDKISVATCVENQGTSV